MIPVGQARVREEIEKGDVEIQRAGPDICDDSFVISFSSSKSIPSYVLESHLTSRSNFASNS